MKARAFRLILAIVVALIAAAGLFNWYAEHSRREAYIARCNEEGAGGMFTSRDYCEALYARDAGRGDPQNAT